MEQTHDLLIKLLIFIAVMAAIGIILRLIRGEERVEIFSKSPLSDIEKIAYKKLIEIFKDEKIVLAQVAFSSFIRTKGSKSASLKKWMQLRQKVADFVICNQELKIEYVIEIDDMTHKKEKDSVRDKALKEAGIRTLRIRATDIQRIDLRSVINEWEKIS